MKIAGIVLFYISIIGFILAGIIFVRYVGPDESVGGIVFAFFIALIAFVFALVGAALFFFGRSRNIGGIRCPECNAPTELRTVKKGKNTGNKFWVCIKYPECKGRVQA
jgi:hypothetical protein